MTNNDFQKILKELRNIKPDAQYSENSKYLILSSKQSRNPEFKKGFFESIYSIKLPKTIAASGLVAIFALIIIVTVSYISKPNQNGFIAEADEVNSSIQIKLDDIKYYIDDKQNFATSTASQVLTILNNAKTELEQARDISSTDTEEALNKIKNAQRIFSEMDSLLKTNQQ